MPDPLFTIVCEYRGGTYVSQVRARDERHAFAGWAEVLRRDRPMGDAADRIAVQADEEAGPLTALDGLSGVWCWTADVEEHFLLANIIRTG